MIDRVPSRFHSDDGQYFDSAFLAHVPEEIVAGATRRQKRAWDEVVEGGRDSIGSVLAPVDNGSYSFNPDDYVSLFTNTTSAFKRLLAQIERSYAGSRPALLTTDLEYPGCVAAIDDSWTGPVVMAQVSGGLMSRLPDADEYLHDALVRAFNFVKPRVVLVSHVMRTTGQVLSVKTLKYFREANPCVVVIVDGSQAIGNIVVKEELLRECDFYIASGHKWLGGMTTSGFVWHREPDRWRVADPAQAVAFRGQRQLGGSGNAAAWISLAASVADMTRDRPRARLQQIAQHNRALGKIFHDRLRKVQSMVEFVTPLPKKRPGSGLVTIGVSRPAGDTIDDALRIADFEFSELEHEQIRWRAKLEDRFLLRWDPVLPTVGRVSEYTPTRPKRPRREFRFCFHYWHKEDDVVRLADAIVEHVEMSRGV